MTQTTDIRYQRAGRHLFFVHVAGRYVGMIGGQRGAWIASRSHRITELLPNEYPTKDKAALALAEVAS